MPITLPTLPPLGEYPTTAPMEGPSLEKLQADWREMARLYVSTAEVEARQACHEQVVLLRESLPGMVDGLMDRWDLHDTSVDRNTAALDHIATAVGGLSFPAGGGTTTGLPVELVTALLVAIIGALKPSP